MKFIICENIYFIQKIVDKVPKQEPFDTSNISHERSSSNKYLNLISMLKQSTQEYYNIRMILGLECAKTYS